MIYNKKRQSSLKLGEIKNNSPINFRKLIRHRTLVYNQFPKIKKLKSEVATYLYKKFLELIEKDIKYSCVSAIDKVINKSTELFINEIIEFVDIGIERKIRSKSLNKSM